MNKLLLIALFSIGYNAAAWEVYDSDGNYYDVESYSQGRVVELYNQTTGEYKDVEIDQTYNYGTETEIEMYDYNTGEYSTYGSDN